MSINYEQNINRIQQEVDDAIRSVGGYWPPLSGLARVAEELGEIAEELPIKSGHFEDALSREIADLFIITTCLANQYCVNLRLLYEERAASGKVRSILPHGKPAQFDYVFRSLAAHCGQLARIVNNYEGSKPFKSTEIRSSVGQEILKIHFSLLSLTMICPFSVFSDIRTVLARCTIRDKGRFGIYWDPTTSCSLQNFLRLSGQPLSIAMGKPRLWGAPCCHDFFYTGVLTRDFTLAFQRFIRISGPESLDGYVIEVPRTQTITILQSLDGRIRHMAKILGGRQIPHSNDAPGTGRSFLGRFLFSDSIFDIKIFNPPSFFVKSPSISNSAAAFVIINPVKIIEVTTIRGLSLSVS